MIKKLFLLAVIAAVVSAYFVFGGERYFDIRFFQEAYQSNPWQSAIIFFALYVTAAALSLPAAAVLTVISGAIFGLATGTILSSFASSIGAALACGFSRYLLRDWVVGKVGSFRAKIDKGVEQGGGSYLFSLRLIPIFPFWAINLAFGLTQMPLARFYWVSQLGMLPGTLIYVNAGAQLGAVDEFTVTGIMTPGVIGSFILLAIFPYVSKGLMSFWHRVNLYRPFRKPRKFDTNLIVIGAGSGGLVASYIAAAVKAKVTLIERHLMGGDCLNTGCVPSKSLVHAARLAHSARSGAAVGVVSSEPYVDMRRIMAKVRENIERISPNDSAERYRALGVECVAGTARLVSPWEVEVDGHLVTAPNIIIATGARPTIPDIPGLGGVAFLTSDSLWQLDALPERLLVVGGGPVGCEMAQAFQRLGSNVTLLQRSGRLLPKCDIAASQLVAQVLASEGVDVRLDSHPVSVRDGLAEIAGQAGGEEIVFDQLLLAVGRTPNTGLLNLENLGIRTADDGRVLVNQYLQTRYPNIYACGDVCGPYQMTHASSHQAWHASVNALFGRFRKFKIDYRLMPSVIYTDPEIAWVGLTEEQAQREGRQFEVTEFDLGGLDRAIADDATSGFIRVLTEGKSDRLLGVTIVAPRAGEMLGEFVSAMKHGKGLNSILATIHPYPGYLDGNKLAAGQWKRNHVPTRLLKIVNRYHAWRRG